MTIFTMVSVQIRQQGRKKQPRIRLRLNPFFAILFLWRFETTACGHVKQ